MTIWIKNYRITITFFKIKMEELNAYEKKLSDPDSWQLELDKQTKFIFYTYDLVNTFGDLLYYFFNRAATYYDYTTSKSLQCESERARSIDDCYLVCRGYNFNITLKQLKELVESFYVTKKEDIIIDGKKYSYLLSHTYCSTVRKRVHSSFIYIDKNQLNKFLDEKGLNYGRRKKEEI